MQDIISKLKYKINGFDPNTLYAFLLLAITVTFSACSVTRHVPDDSYLLRKNKIKLESDKKRNEKSELKEQLESLTAQQPNTYLFGMWPYKVWLYNMRYKKYQKDTTNFQIKSKTVEAPVILDSAAITKTIDNMGFHLFNAGYFHHFITPSIDTADKKAKVTYNVETGNRFIIQDISYEVADDQIKQILISNVNNSILKIKDFYSNTIAGEERNRIVNLMKENGYFNFNAENVKLELDTLSATTTTSDNLAGSIIDMLLSRSRTSYELNVKIIVEDNQEQTAFKQYKIGNVIVYMNMTDTMRLGNLYQMANQQSINDEIKIMYEGPSYVSKNVLERKILIKPNQLYAQSDYDRTIRQLTDLFVFQYIRIRYSEPTREDGDAIVNAIILLSPSKRFEYNFNTEVSGGDIYVFGTNVNTSVTYNNIFKSANQLILTGSAGIAFENAEKRRLQLFSQTFGANARLQVPGLLFFNPYLFGKETYTRTILGGGLNYMDRSHFFFLRNITAGLTYQVTYPNFVTWNFKPAFVNILTLSNISQQFQDRMDSIPAIKNAYQPVFIEGQGIEFIMNSNPIFRNKKYYLRLGLEEGGLLLSTLNNITPIKNYAEYVRFDFDGRQYFFNSFSTMILRFHGGVGIPYGRSTTLPYIKQYFVGGAYSIRGWRPRVLGPGSYRDPKIDSDGLNNLFIDQAGDIKLELNAEYRFTIARLFANAISLNGAVFADAGNIWLARRDEQLPNAEFNFKRLGQDIAVSSGLGFRIDFGGFLVVRFDYAIQMKKPYEPTNNGWTIQHMKLGDPEWRRNNTNFNIAIGYPF